MANLIEQFKKSSSRLRGHRAPTAGYPAEARALAVQYAQGELAGGKRIATVASRLGVSSATLRKWVSEADRPTRGSLRQVVVAKEKPRKVRPAEAGLTITTSGGHVITGLDPSTAAAILKALG